MFAIIRHAGYTISTGSLTPQGQESAQHVAELLSAYSDWKEVRVSPTPRTVETGQAIAERLNLPCTEDNRLSMDGDMSDLLPPTEPHGIIFVSHLPIITKYVAKWSKRLDLPELGTTEIAAGWLIDPEQRSIKPIS